MLKIEMSGHRRENKVKGVPPSDESDEMKTGVGSKSWKGWKVKPLYPKTVGFSNRPMTKVTVTLSELLGAVSQTLEAMVDHVEKTATFEDTPVETTTVTHGPVSASLRSGQSYYKERTIEPSTSCHVPRDRSWLHTNPSQLRMREVSRKESDGCLSMVLKFEG